MRFHGTKRLTLVLALSLLGLAGCQNSLSPAEITSTPVATPIVVRQASASPTPAAPHTKTTLNEERIQRVEAMIEAARKGFPGRSGIVFIDLETDLHLEFSATERFESASLVKLIVLSELYRQVQLGERSPDELLTLTASQKVGGSGQLKDAKVGEQYSIKRLAELMIIESDNTATQILTDLLGRDAVQENAKRLDLSATTFERDIFDFEAIDKGRDNVTSAQDIGSFLRQIARQEVTGSEQMHEILEQQKRNDVLNANFPPNIRVAHKTGELNGILNDAAIVYAPKGTFILVVLSDHVQDKDSAKKQWAKMTFDILQLYSEPTPSTTPKTDS